MIRPAAPLTRFIAASGLTNLADGVAVVVWAWVASLLTRDPLLIAVMPVALRLPWFLCALPAGVITDRVDRHRLIMAMDAVRAVAFAGAMLVIVAAEPLPAAAETGTDAPFVYMALLVCALAVGVAEVFRDNAAQTMLPALVPHDTLERANGRLWSVELVGNSLVGPALGAFLVAVFVWAPFAANAAAYALAFLFLTTIQGSFRPPQRAASDWQAELKEGIGFLRGAPLLQTLAVVTGVWNLLHQTVIIALVLYVQEVLGLGAPAYGLILAAGAVGGILGGFFGERIVALLGPGTTAQWMTLASAVAFAAIPLAPNAITLALILAAFEFTGICWNTVSVSHRQRAIPDALLGRVNSIYRLFAWGMMPIGLILSGLVVRWTDGPLGRADALAAPFFVAALGAAILTALAWRPLGRGFAAALRAT